MPLVMEIPVGHPMRDAWEIYVKTKEYANVKKWATHPEHVDGSLWAAFAAGYRASENKQSGVLSLEELFGDD